MLNTYMGGVICIYFSALSWAPTGSRFESEFQTPMELNSNIRCSFKVYVSNKERRQVLDPQLPTPKEDTKTKPIANNPKDRYQIFTLPGGTVPYLFWL